MATLGFFETDDTATIGTFTLWSANFNTYLNPFSIGFHFYIKSVSGLTGKYYRLYTRLNDGEWIYVRNYSASQPSFEHSVSYNYDDLLDYNSFEVKICDPDDLSHVVAFGKVYFSSNTLKTEEVFVGEYDYTQYFEDLVSSSESQTSLITNIKNNVQSITENVVSNHAMLFVLFLLALTVLVERTLKGVIK